MCKGYFFHHWHKEPNKIAYRINAGCAEKEKVYAGVWKAEHCCRCGKRREKIMKHCHMSGSTFSHIMENGEVLIP